MSGERPARRDEPAWTRLLPLLLVPVSLLPDLAAAIPARTYFFRDFGIAFAPWRLLAAREMLALRLPTWNPYGFEGSFLAPTLYPLDLLLLLRPDPAFLSWLLTLHLPLAALAAYWLARELGARRAGAFVAGAAYALSGVSLSSLNLYVYLQAYALAPLVVGLLRRAAADRARVALAAAVLAAALSTMAVEFVGQAVLLGIALALAASPGPRALARVAGASLLGAGLAALPAALALGAARETVRGEGFGLDVALANAVHPAVLLQTLLPNLFGLPSSPLEAWWGARFFTQGLPYFLSLYLGPVVLALAVSGAPALERRSRIALVALAGIGLAWALGPWGGLSPLAAELPLLRGLRYPSKALLLPTLAVCLLAGTGLDRLTADRAAARRGALVFGAIAALGAGVVALIAAAPAGLVRWSGVATELWPTLVRVAVRDASAMGLVALAGAAVALAVGHGRLRAGVGGALLATVLIADLARAGAGLNPQVPAAYFDLLPETRALGLDGEERRVFSYGVEQSPAFARLRASGGAGRTLATAFVSHQVLSPFGNALHRIEVVEGTDPQLVVPRGRELAPAYFAPARVADLVPFMRNAAVTHVVSLDPLDHPDLGLMARVPLGPPGLDLLAYRLGSTAPRAFVACRAVAVPTQRAALAAPYEAGFDLARDVALEEADPRAGRAPCATGSARRLAGAPTSSVFEVEADGDGLFVLRESHASGWKASVDGHEVRVLRANGKHRAVAVPAGRHELRLRYEPPGLAGGLLVSLLAALVALATIVGRGRGRYTAGR